MSSRFTRTLTSLAACALTAVLLLATLPVDGGAGVTIISFI